MSIHLSDSPLLTMAIPDSPALTAIEWLLWAWLFTSILAPVGLAAGAAIFRPKKPWTGALATSVFTIGVMNMVPLGLLASLFLLAFNNPVLWIGSLVLAGLYLWLWWFAYHRLTNLTVQPLELDKPPAPDDQTACPLHG